MKATLCSKCDIVLKHDINDYCPLCTASVEIQSLQDELFEMHKTISRQENEIVQLKKELKQNGNRGVKVFVCGYCKKETTGIPMVSSNKLPMICEYCGTQKW